MIYKTIPIVERADGSLQIDARNINLRQGDYNFKLQYSTNKDYSEYSPIVNVQVAFRRKDGQQTGWLPMTHIRDKEYSINLKNTWFTKEAGILYMTFRVFQTNENNVQLIINTASASLPITPIAQFNPEEEDLLPSEFEVFQSQVNERLEDAVYNDNNTLKTFTGSTINPKTVSTQVTTTRGTVQSDINQLYNDISLQKLGKGIFDNEQELLSQYPNGSNFPEGTWAVLLSTNTVWLYNSQTKQWYNSTRTITDIFELDDNVYKFAKQLYEESSNLFDEETAYSARNYKLSKSGEEFSCNSNVFCIGASGNSIGQYVINVPKNTTKLYFKFKAKSSDLNVVLTNMYLCTVDYDGVSKNYAYNINRNVTNIYVEYSGSVNLQRNVQKLGFTQYLTNSNNSTIYVKDFMISLDNVNYYQPYNPNRHITNEQAEYLKEEYDKILNLFDISETYVISNSANNATVNISGGKISYNTTYSNSASGQATIRFYIDNDMLENGKTYNVSSVVNYTLPEGASGQADLRLARSYLSTNSWGGQDKKQTIDKSTYYYYFVLYLNLGAQTTTAGTYTGEVSNIMLCEGEEPLPYQPYNSVSHITNPQADLLKSEWEKQLNNISINPETYFSVGVTLNFNDIGYTLNGTATANFYRSTVLKTPIKAGTYYIKVFTSGSASGWVGTNFVGASGSVIYNVPVTLPWTKTVTFTEDVTKIDVGTNIDVVLNNFKVSFMLTKDLPDPSEALPWNGPIIHEKDITPVLLWKNGSPNSEFAEQTITTSNLQDFKNIIIKCKWYAGNNLLQDFVFKYETGRSGLLFFNRYASNTTYASSRDVTITSNTQITFSNGYENGNIQNARCIPVEIYGSNY